MKPKLIITTVVPQDLDVNIPNQTEIDLPSFRIPSGRVSGNFTIYFEGTNDFSEYVIDGKFNKSKFYNDILRGDLPLVGAYKINEPND